MKFVKSKSCLFAVFVASSLVAVPVMAGGTHDHKHDSDMMEFDPVDNEFGSYEDDMKVSRTIEIGMSDEMKFEPNVIKVKKGEVIAFVHENHGQMMHEFVLGTGELLDEHAEMMKKFPNMEHSEPYMSHVAPGKKGEMVWKFDKEGEFSFGCLIPGHYDAGMTGKVIVES